MNEPLVSIITPCYNSEEYLERYLNSVLEQSYEKIEQIIVNDGSTDDTEKIVNDYRKKFEKRGYKIVYKYQNNKGLGAAINAALKLVTGDYFTWCDPDNFFTKDYVETKVNFFTIYSKYSIVRCDGYVVKDTDIKSVIAKMADGNTNKYKEDLFYNAIEEKNFHFGCAMLKTMDFDKINPCREIYESRFGQNWQLLLPMFYYYRSGYIDKPMFYFVHRSNSVSNSATRVGMRALLAQQYEHISILKNTIISMNIPEQEQCISIIDIKYAKNILRIAHKYIDIELLDMQYRYLKDLNVATIADKITYISGKYFIINYIRSMFLFAISILRKIVY